MNAGSAGKLCSPGAESLRRQLTTLYSIINVAQRGVRKVAPSSFLMATHALYLGQPKVCGNKNED